MKNLVIGYDAKRAVRNMTGLGNYSRFVIDAMSATYPDNRYLLYSPRSADNPRLAPLLERNNVELRLPDTATGRRFASLWRSLGGIPSQLRRDQVALYHGLSNELPLKIAKARIPSVVTIHDLIYRRIKHDYKYIDRKLYDFKYRRSAVNATRIIAISQRTKVDLISDYNIPEEKIDVIYQGCSEIFLRPASPEQIAAVTAKYRLPEQYIVMVGTIQSRKNQLLAVKALAALPDDLHLVLVGRRMADYAPQIDDFIARNRLSERVIWIENIPFADLPSLYAGAIFSVYPSRYEGFGIPVIESLGMSTPVIAATGSCLEEAGGPGALYVDPDDLEAMVETSRRLLDDAALRQQLAADGREHIRKFDPANFARLTAETYLRAIAEYH